MRCSEAIFVLTRESVPVSPVGTSWAKATTRLHLRLIFGECSITVSWPKRLPQDQEDTFRSSLAHVGRSRPRRRGQSPQGLSSAPQGSRGHRIFSALPDAELQRHTARTLHKHLVFSGKEPSLHRTEQRMVQAVGPCAFWSLHTSAQALGCTGAPCPGGREHQTGRPVHLPPSAIRWCHPFHVAKGCS